MKFGQLIAFLKSALVMSPSSLVKPINLERVIIALAFTDRRIKLMSEGVFDPSQ